MAGRSSTYSFSLLFRCSALHVVVALHSTHTYCFLFAPKELVFLCFLPFFSFVQISLNLVWLQKLRTPLPRKHNLKTCRALASRIAEQNAAHLMSKLTTEKCYEGITFPSNFKLPLSVNCVTLVRCSQLCWEKPAATFTGINQIYFSEIVVVHLPIKRGRLDTMY